MDGLLFAEVMNLILSLLTLSWLRINPWYFVDASVDSFSGKCQSY